MRHSTLSQELQSTSYLAQETTSSRGRDAGRLGEESRQFEHNIEHKRQQLPEAAAHLGGGLSLVLLDGVDQQMAGRAGEIRQSFDVLGVGGGE